MRLCRLVPRGLLCLALVLLSAPLMAGEPELPSSPLGQNYPLFQASLEEENESEILPIPDPKGDLSLQQALRLTMRHNPKLAAAAWNSAASAAEKLQAGLLPNPTVSVEIENFAGDNDMNGFDAAETTLSVGQQFELGGKRDMRKQVARLRQQLSNWDRESTRLDVLTAVTRAYIELAAAQQRVAQADGLTELAGAVQRAVQERVEAGKVSPLEETRAGVELSTARLNAAKARRSLQAARKTLASFWGASTVRFGQASDVLQPSSALPSLEQLRPAIDKNPDLARWSTELEQMRAERGLAEAEAVPDLMVSVGVRNFQDSGDNALVAGLEIPLPLFDRNQGGRRQAAAGYYRARRQQQEARSRIETDLSVAYQQLQSAHGELLMLKEELLPGAEQAFDATSFGYREGKFDFLEMVDAQRTLFEVRGQYVDALASCHLARADIERLIAQPLNLHSNSEEVKP